MRKIASFTLLVLLVTTVSGCIIVATDRCKGCRLSDNERIVHIDGEPYVIDIEKHTANRLDSATIEVGK